MSIQIAQDPAIDEVLGDDPFALLVGMLLDQRNPMHDACGLGAERTLTRGVCSALTAQGSWT